MINNNDSYLEENTKIIKEFRELPTFNIIVATIGRSSLSKLLNSLENELNENDAITIIFDGQDNFNKSNFSNDLLKNLKCKVIVIIQEPKLGFWGHGIRNKYQGNLEVKTTFILNADDDDTYVPGAFDLLRESCTDPNTLYIGKMQHSTKIIPRQNKKILMSDIGTPCGIIPFDIASKSVWEWVYGGDFHYYNNLQNYCSKVEFLDIITYKVGQ